MHRVTDVGWHPPQPAPPAVRQRPSRGWVVSRIILGLVWLGAIAAASLAALSNRPEFAGVQRGAWLDLVLFSIPGVVIAILAIRTTAILVVTALVAAGVSAFGSWSTMRDTSSTAAIGVLTTPLFALAIVGVGCVVEMIWNSSTRQTNDGA